MTILTTMFNDTKNPQGLNVTSLAANILRYAPNGTAPLFALTDSTGSTKATAVTHGYFSKTMELTRVVVDTAAVAADTTIALTNSNNAGLVEGMVLHCMATGENIRVASVGSNSITVTRGFGRISAADIPAGTELFVVGTAHPEGSARPTPRSIQAVYVSNFTQIFRNAWAVTGTARETLAKAGWNNVAESQRDAGYFHAAEIEAAMFFGQASMSTGTNGQPLHSTQGIIDAVRQYAPDNIEDITGDAVDYDDMCDILVNAYKVSQDHSNPTVRIAYCDSTAMRSLQKLGREYGNRVQLSTVSDVFGQSFQTLTFYKGTVHFKEHPLFQQLGIDSGLVVVVDVPSIKLAYLGNRKQTPENFNFGGSYGGNPAISGATSADGVDGLGGSILSELAVEILNPYGCAVIQGFDTVKPFVQKTTVV